MNDIAKIISGLDRETLESIVIAHCITNPDKLSEVSDSWFRDTKLIKAVRKHKDDTFLISQETGIPVSELINMIDLSSYYLETSTRYLKELYQRDNLIKQYKGIVHELETNPDLSSIQNLKTKDVNVSDMVKEFVEQTDGEFSLQECYIYITENYKSLQSITKTKLQNTIRVSINRLKSEGVVEKAGKRNGIYQKIDKNTSIIDFKNITDEGKIGLYYPFGIEGLYQTYRKNIIVVAGSSDAGKTAMLLNFVRMNMENHKILYMSSEMGDREFYSRLSKFDDIKINDWTFDAIERVNDFHALIRPDDINIIDYLEVTKDFYLVEEYIQKIFMKLNKGIAVIALQKNPGSELARGGAGSLSKARLYVSIDRNKSKDGMIIKIIKCKNWATDTNPNGLCRDFKIENGCNIIPQGFWRRGD